MLLEEREAGNAETNAQVQKKNLCLLVPAAFDAGLLPILT